jgi:hypothetical protein
MEEANPTIMVRCMKAFPAVIKNRWMLFFRPQPKMAPYKMAKGQVEWDGWRHQIAPGTIDA